MMEITITGKKEDESNFSLKIDTKIIELDLAGNQLMSIDLTPIKGCKELRSLDLADNHLKEIDLTPIKECKKLTTLDLGYNHLKEIDLTPIKRCKKLSLLQLRSNQFKEIDLTPLKECKKLRSLRLQQYSVDYLIATIFPELKWTEPIQNSSTLPVALREFSDKLEQAWQEYQQQKK